MADHDLLREVGELVVLIILALLRSGQNRSTKGRKSLPPE